jgi:hypothetical protein
MNKKDYPAIKLPLLATWQTDQCIAIADDAWLVTNLWEAAKDLPVYEVPLVGMDLSIIPWSGVGDNFLELLAHVKLIQDADMSHPVILCPDGTVADGRHRIAHAVVNGHSTIKIQRLLVMPEPDYCNTGGNSNADERSST